jgi:integrase
MRTGKLTALAVRKLVKPGRYGDGGGLWLQVREGGRRSWLLRYMLAGRAREMGLGAEADVSLAEARELAREARKLARAGRDPIEQRRELRRAGQGAGMTFRDVALLYIAAHEGTWRNDKHRAQWTSTLETYAYPVLGSLPVPAVDTGAVLRVLEPIWREKPETASRLRGRIESVLDYARARGWCEGDNPARWRGHLANLMPSRAKVAAVQHHAALPWQAAPAFMAQLGTQEGLAAKALAFTVLTAARTGEALGATWGELDLDAPAWTVPAGHMKAGREHRVPLSGPALALLRALRPEDAQSGVFVFPGARAGKSLSNMAMTAVLRRMKRGDLTVHGFRSTFRDWCAEQTAYPREVAEAALAHTLRDKVEAAYRRRGDLFERRARLMAEWAGYLARPATPAEVVPMRRSRRAGSGQGCAREPARS